MNTMRAVATLLLVNCCAALSPHASVLRRCGSATPPSAAEATRALREIVNARQDDWTPLLDRRWRPVFSVKPDADEGRFLTVKAEQEFRSDGSFTNAIRLLGLKFVFAGTYALQGSTTTLVIERLRLKILGVPMPAIDVREGRGIRGLIERIRGRRKDGSKRPNVYSWCYADGDVCVARGSSGSTAVWVRADG
ncbi:unnamed protein product [Pelagomonas calceolata]|uniref:Plastid lipid-associated protein/fibrillin conserved domain-containing protein n=1 Tax=Pelagomonas calceolata TaxID=35677 RepID=A0A8J2SQX1_9STRA|nr:unnamed protein product [Pelagomonas calceolata]